MTMSVRAPASNAENLIRATGERKTAARVQILALLLAAPRALTHHEVEEALDPSLAIDRVTVYRVLDWLTQQNLAHKISSDDRVWRFNAAPIEHEGHHAHFRCTRCGEVICLKDTPADSLPRLPKGYLPEAMEVTVRGLCRECRPRRKGRVAARETGRKRNR
jgi:Fur family ferric uptake transcriptional regulator